MLHFQWRTSRFCLHPRLIRFFTKLNFRCHNPEGKSPHLKCKCTCSIKSACIQYVLKNNVIWGIGKSMKMKQHLSEIGRFWAVGVIKCYITLSRIVQILKDKIVLQKTAGVTLQCQSIILQCPVLWNKKFGLYLTIKIYSPEILSVFILQVSNTEQVKVIHFQK